MSDGKNRGLEGIVAAGQQFVLQFARSHVLDQVERPRSQLNRLPCTWLGAGIEITAALPFAGEEAEGCRQNNNIRG